MKFLTMTFLVFFFLSMFISAQAGKEVTDCDDPNEVYLYCGSGCPARCGDKPGERVCTPDCVKGCFCKKGLVLNSQNKCVKPEKC